jgi:GDP-L-fucose synthase
MKILLTGGTGMVGRSILSCPQAAAHTIVAPTRDDLDLINAGAVREYFRRVLPDLIVHAAGKVGGIAANLADPYGFLFENTQIGLNVVGAALEVGVPQLLNLASSCIYPRDHQEPLREVDLLSGPLEPSNEGYALAKVVTLRLCEYARTRSPSLAYCTLIPCNLYGPHDKFDPRHSHLIPAAIHKVHSALEGNTSVEIWGDGTARREFMFVDDLADAVLRAANDMRGLPPVMNIGIGRDRSVLEYYQAVAEVVGWTGSFSFDAGRPVGMWRKLLDVSRQSSWGWQPRTGLADGIRATYSAYLAGISK